MFSKSVAIVAIAFVFSANADIPAPPSTQKSCAENMINSGLMGDVYKSLGSGDAIINLKSNTVYGPAGAIDIDPTKMRCTMIPESSKKAPAYLSNFLVKSIDGSIPDRLVAAGFKKFESLTAQQQIDVVTSCHKMASSVSDHDSATKFITAPLKDENLLSPLLLKARKGKFSLGEGFPPAAAGQ